MRQSLATTTALVITLLVITLLIGCGEAPATLDWQPAPEEPEAAAEPDMADFEDSVFDLQATFGSDDKQDLVSRASVCQLIAPVARYGDAIIQGGLVLGIEGTLVVGPIDAFGGYDMVWDLYHQEFTVSRYGGSITTMDEAAISGTAYIGFAAGLRGGVGDWYGFHEAVSVEVGLPFLDDFFSIDVTAFRSAVDQNGDGVADASEVLAPPDGVFGYTVGLTLGVDAVADPLPVELTLQEGYWEPHKELIRKHYDRLRSAKVLGFDLPIAARLIDTADGSECAENWPDDEPDRDCAIALGKPDTSYARRALHVARSMCHVTKSCALPMTWGLAGAAIAVGKLRDMGLTPSQLCPDVVDPTYAGRSLDPH
ncbi:MAG: hypothetical protein ACI9WU_003839 [Myxococcota bacterium]